MIEVLKQMVEALQTYGDKHRETYLLAGAWDEEITKGDAAIQAGRQAIKDLEGQEPVAHSVISGALFDFMGWLTSRKERIVLSSADNASPAVEVITEFARMRNLSLDDANVQDWHTHPPQRTWQGLTNDELTDLFYNTNLGQASAVAQAIALLKQKNGYAEEKNT
jgi:hypothetical protein